MNVSAREDQLLQHIAQLESRLGVVAKRVNMLEKKLERAVPDIIEPKTWYRFELLGQWHTAISGKDLLVKLFRLLSDHFPEFPELAYERFQSLGNKRSYVAPLNELHRLYPGRPDLLVHKAKFTKGWYVGTNESNKTKIKLIRLACDSLGLVHGKELRVKGL
jgi:hypothetical protein